MATSTRGSASTGKEKKGISPSSSTVKRTPKPLSDDKPNSPTESSKYVPSHLRPTKNSNLDPNKQPKKPTTDATTSKPTYTRRKSFDHPPPSSQVQKSVRGGTTSGAAGARDIKTQRSSSFSPNSATSSSSRTSSERVFARTSSGKDGKAEPNLSKSRSVKKSNLASSTKKEPTSTNRKKASTSVAPESSVGYDNQPSVDHLNHEDDLAGLDDHEGKSLPEMSEMPDNSEDLADPTNAKEEDEPMGTLIEDDRHDEEEKSLVVDQESGEIELDDSHPVQDVEATEEKLDEAIGDQQDEAEEKVSEVELSDKMMEEDLKEGNVSLEIDAKSIDLEETEAKDESETVTNLITEAKDESEAVTNPITEAKDESETVSNPITEAKDESKTVTIPITDSTTPKTAQPSSAGKRDKQDYNDVIEETATKLMGSKRSNKVLALAGAFETVISLEGNNKG